MATLKLRQPTGQPSLPVVLVAGLPKTGKSWVAAELTGDDRIGASFWLDLGEGTGDEYITVPGARYQMVDHDGTYRDILEQVQAVVALPRTDGKPNVLVIDTISDLWRMLSAQADAVARRRRSNQRKLQQDPDAEVTIQSDLWNRATAKFRAVLDPLLTWDNGIAVLVARGEDKAVFEGNAPLEGVKHWKVEGQKGLAGAVQAIVRCTAPGKGELVGVRSTLFAGDRPSEESPLALRPLSLADLIFDRMQVPPTAGGRRMTHLDTQPDEDSDPGVDRPEPQQRRPMPNHKGPVAPGEYDADGMNVSVEGPERDEAHAQLVAKAMAEAKRVKALAAEGDTAAQAAVELIRKILDGGQFRELSTRKLNQILAAVEEGTEPWPDESAAPAGSDRRPPQGEAAGDGGQVEQAGDLTTVAPGYPAHVDDAPEPSPADLEAEAAALASRRKATPELAALTGGDWIALAEQHLGLDATDFGEWLFAVFGDDLPDLAALADLGPDQREVVYESIVAKVQPEGAAA